MKISPTNTKNQSDGLGLQLAFHTFIILISIVSGLWVLPLIFTFCSFIANWLSYFVASATTLWATRKMFQIFAKVLGLSNFHVCIEFLYWHMNWHIEHHMYAGVPCYNLRKLHLELKDDMPTPRTLFSAWQEMLSTWQRQQVDKNYQYDTPLPSTARTERKRRGDALESSIGDLAPEGLV